ncbi:MAG: cupin domain-containing protein [Thermoleophilia bacterium]|nr:cupin domain-containing protein [Thermoleophilia bacterium]
MTTDGTGDTAMGWTLRNLRDVEDVAPKYGFEAVGEARFPRADLGAEGTGLAYHRIRPAQRQAFAHRHEAAEEVHVILSGGGTATLDGEEVALRPMDALRVSPRVARIFTAGPEGLEYLVFGPHLEGDGEMLPADG